MFKAILVSAAIFSAPAMAKAIDPVAALTGLIRMEAAKQFCGLPINERAAIDLVDIVTPHLKSSPQEFVDAIRRAAAQLGNNYTNNGNLGAFCAHVGKIYGKYEGRKVNGLY